MDNKESYKAHIIVLAYHGQGHINPLLQFSKRLAANGLKITLTTTLSNTNAIQATSCSTSINFESIYDDHAQGGVAGSGGFKGFLDRFQAIGSRHLIDIIAKFQDSRDPVRCLIYDANIPWASDVANEFGVLKAAFFTQSCAFVASCYPMHCDLSGATPSVPLLSMRGFPELMIPDLPSLGPQTGRYPPIIRYILSQFDNSENADWVLFNSFHKLEEEVINWMSKLWPVMTIGPTLPSVYLDNRIKDDNEYGFHTHEPSTDSCMKWLDSKEAGSVLYVSFGSAASLSKEQTSEIARALAHSNKNFLWVVKPSEEDKIPPTNFGSENRGLVVRWAPQLAVLAHGAVGCFISHCGWNSTVEAISLGVAVVAMPQFLDQMTNAHCIEHVWKVGIEAKRDEGMGYICSGEINRCVDEIMDQERGEEIKKNVGRWRVLAKEAIDRGGTSDACIHQIIDRLTI